MIERVAEDGDTLTIGLYGSRTGDGIVVSEDSAHGAGSLHVLARFILFPSLLAECWLTAELSLVLMDLRSCIPSLVRDIAARCI